MKKRSFSFGALVGVCVLVGGAPVGLAQVGIDWVSPPPAPAVPVEQVDRMVLPPPAFEGGPVALTPESVPSSVPSRSVGTVVPRRGAGGGDSAVSRALPAGNDVYPPPGNRAAQPLSGAVRLAPAMLVPVVKSEPSVPAASAPVSVASSGPASGVSGAVPVVREPLVAPVPAPQKMKPIPMPVETPSMPPPPVIEGFGDHLPLSIAIEQIVPPGYTVDVQGALDMNMNVSWAGGRPFDKVLEDMIYAHGYRVLLDGARVILHPAASRVAAMVSAPVEAVPPSVTEPRVVPNVPVTVVSPPPSPSVSVAPRGEPQPQQRPAPTYMPGRIDIFSGRVGESLPTVLSRWTRLAHLDFEWAVPTGDYPLPQSFAMNTTFPRALEKMMALYKGQTPALVATLAPGPVSKLVVRLDQPVAALQRVPVVPAMTAPVVQPPRSTVQPKYQSPGFTFE
jgi:hypothetical protein